MKEIKRTLTVSKKKDLAVDIFFRVLLILMSIICLFPFVHVFSKSISEESFVIANKVVLLPKGFSLNA